jgi:hypothetical protein
VAAAFESEEFRWSGLFGLDQFLLDRNLVLTATKDRDTEAKAFRPPSTHCALYAYLERTGPRFQSECLIHIDRHDGGPVQPLSSSTYLYWLVDPGEHTIDVNRWTPHLPGAPTPKPKNRRSYTSDCAAGAALFFRVHVRTRHFGRTTMTIEAVDSETGHEAITVRRRVLEDG